MDLHPSTAYMATKSQIRQLVLEALDPTQRNVPSQFRGLQDRVSQRLAERDDKQQRGDPLTRPLEGEDEQFFREVVWELIATGVIVPGLDAHNQEWPFISLTKEGRDYLERREPSPADPHGFLDHVRHAYSRLSNTSNMYLQEAIRAFNQRLYLSTSVMLGVAAEGLLLDVAEAVKESHVDAEVGLDWWNQKIDNQPALRQHRAITDRLESVLDDMPYRAREKYEAHFTSIYGLIREQRNEAGHPTGTERTRDEALASLYLFTPFAAATNGLVEWLGGEERFPPE